jgi:hypothetical protein
LLTGEATVKAHVPPVHQARRRQSLHIAVVLSNAEQSDALQAKTAAFTPQRINAANGALKM